MPALQLRCKTCSKTFDSGINPGGFPRPVLGPHKYKCPYCRATALYTNRDFTDKHPDAPDFPVGVYAGAGGASPSFQGIDFVA
jgi:DNA-directed RNA polymerase subunit RPC12/RpoP